VVLRQPFGGMGKSVFGPGVKAGGPNYVAQLMDFADRASAQGGAASEEPASSDPVLAGLAARLRADRSGIPAGAGGTERVLTAMGSYRRAWDEELGREHDHFRLLGQDNIRRYLPVRQLRIRVHEDDSLFELLARIAAARTVGSRIIVSVPPGSRSAPLAWLGEATGDWGDALETVEEDDETLAQVIRDRRTERVRFAAQGRVPLMIHEAARNAGSYLAARPVLAEGRVELLWYLREQSISVDYHRYGNLGERSQERRAPLL